MHRSHANTTPLYIKNLNICRFWNPRGPGTNTPQILSYNSFVFGGRGFIDSRNHHIFIVSTLQVVFIGKEVLSWQKPDTHGMACGYMVNPKSLYNREGLNILMPLNIGLHFSPLVFTCQRFGGRVGILGWLLLPPYILDPFLLMVAQESHTWAMHNSKHS